jgi:hemerythrin superfamily protein
MAEENTSHDVIDLVLKDHRTMEDMFHSMRSRESDRASTLRQFSDLLVAHSDAEEAHFYSEVRQHASQKIDGEKEVEHEISEHIEALVALMDVMEIPDTQSTQWEDKFTNLVKAVTHHAHEEELTVHNLARMKISPQQREAMGDAFKRARDQAIQSGVGNIENVRKLVKERASMLQKAKVRLVGP